jgi:hypothetical protein
MPLVTVWVARVGTIAAILNFVTPGISHATLIMAKRTAERIVVAADSREWGKHSPFCKIIHSGDFFFAVAGSLDFPSVDGTSVVGIVYDAAAQQTQFATRVEYVDTAIRRLLKTLLERVKGNKDVISALVERVSIGLLLFGFDHDVPHLSYLHGLFSERLNGDVDVLLIRKDCPGNCGDDGIALAVLGTTQAIEPELEFEQVLRVDDPTKTFIKLEELASDRFPRFVGPPFDVIEVTKEGARWLQRKEECPK